MFDIFVVITFWNQVAQYHILEEEFTEWAAETGGSGKYISLNKFWINLYLFIYFLNKSHRISFVYFFKIFSKRDTGQWGLESYIAHCQRNLSRNIWKRL